MVIGSAVCDDPIAHTLQVILSSVHLICGTHRKHSHNEIRTRLELLDDGSECEYLEQNLIRNRNSNNEQRLSECFLLAQRNRSSKKCWQS